MSADYIQLIGTDVPESSGGCCFTGFVQHRALYCPSEPMTLQSSEPASTHASQNNNPNPNHPNTSSGSHEGQLLFFNCPEGTQRFSVEANLRLTRTRGFFFTRWSVSAVMGMPGLLFTVNDAGLRHANFFGPSSYHLGGDESSTEVVHAMGKSDSTHPTGAETTQKEVIRRDGEVHTMSLVGLEGMLCALRRHYFAYRPMSFQQLCAKPVEGVQHTTTSTTVSGSQSAMHTQNASLSDFMRQRPSALAGNFICEVPMHYPPPQSSHLTPTRSIELALQLSPTSALLAFPISPPHTVSESEIVYGYALLHAPAASFDPRRAKALGVPPGPLYGELKQGRAVWTGDGPQRRLIDPSEVKQATRGSQKLYMSLVLDGDSIGEIASAMNGLFGSNEASGASSDTVEEKKGEGVLRQFLQHWESSMLQCDDGNTRAERDWVLTHVVHVQSAQFFKTPNSSSDSCANLDLSMRCTDYVQRIFAHVTPYIREQVMSGATQHHFCALLQQRYSAFPTALAHRYHLHSIAPAQFPVHTKENDSFEVEEEPLTAATAAPQRGPVWPYLERQHLVSADAAMMLPDTQTTPGEAPKYFRAKGGRNMETAPTLRYPTLKSAVAMLSDTFRQTVVERLRRISREMVHDASNSQTMHVKHNGSSDLPEGGGALTFLGTGSAVPSKYRNVSGTYVEIMHKSGPNAEQRRTIIMLDFGEGNAGQLSMLWGGCTERRRRFLSNLALIFISHAHADHHLGLLSLLELRHSAQLPRSAYPLLVVCPEEVYTFLCDTWGQCAPYRQWLSEEVRFEMIPAEWKRLNGSASLETQPVALPLLNELCRQLHRDSAAATGTITKAVIPTRNKPTSTHVSMEEEESNMGESLWEAEVFPVHHPANAHALLLRFPAAYEDHAQTREANGRGEAARTHVMLFSGDTRPSPILVERCRLFARDRGVFLCLHEATFGEGCEEEAVRKCHSTLPEALQVAEWIEARHVVLNHFSQRYPKLPGLMKSQLGGREVDLHCRRRATRLQGTTGSFTGSCGKSKNALNEATVNSTSNSQRASNDTAVKKSSKENEEDNKRENDMPPEDDGVDEDDEEATDGVAKRMCFGFDFMRLSFASLENGETARLTPIFVRLLEEYESWGVGTSKRLRD